MEKLILLHILKYWLKMIKTDNCILKCSWQKLFKFANENNVSNVNNNCTNKIIYSVQQSLQHLYDVIVHPQCNWINFIGHKL